jgi:SAM-dependent methyltransferase
MNWSYLRAVPWVDTRAKFVSGAPRSGTLLDLGSSDGETLGHIAELRPDLKLRAADIGGKPENYPAGCDFARVDLEREKLPWPDASVDAITCMHLIEHLTDLKSLISETARLLKPGGKVYFETPHPKTVTLPSLRGKFTLNFFDDPTHVRPIGTDELAGQVRSAGLETVESGISRNWMFAAAYPFFALLPASRKKYTSRVHWIGWSAYLIARRPG